MGFSFLRTVAFRNLADAEVNVCGKDIFLVGENGQGKTNFLEALYFCSYASSFRNTRDKDLAKTGEKDFSASVNLDSSLYSNVNITFKDGKKTVMLDGKRVEDRKELLSVAPVIVFCHEDMDFVAGTPERRRWFFDQTRSLWDPLYLEDLRKYRHVLKSRNTVLREHNGVLNTEVATILDALDPQLAYYGLELGAKRHETAEEFSLVFQTLYEDISGIAGIGVKYLPSWKEENIQAVITRLKEKRQNDVSSAISTSGPHRDRYLFTKGGGEFSEKASTGQRRLLALLLRVAQTKVFSEKTGKKPILLLDDVLLELDGEKRRRFLSFMPEYEQAFYTFLPEENYDSYRKHDTIVYYMSSGGVQV